MSLKQGGLFHRETRAPRPVLDPHVQLGPPGLFDFGWVRCAPDCFRVWNLTLTDGTFGHLYADGVYLVMHGGRQ